MKPKKAYILYDERAHYDEDEATALEYTETLEEAKESQKIYPNSVIFEYDLKPDGINLFNGRMV